MEVIPCATRDRKKIAPVEQARHAVGGGLLFKLIGSSNQISVAEQNARVALKHADLGYVLSNGMILKGGPAAELSQSEDIKRFYLGIGEGDKGSSERASHGVNIDWMRRPVADGASVVQHQF